MEDQIARDDEDAQAHEAFIWFLRALTAAKTVSEVNAAAGALLQDLGEEPSDG